MGERIEVRGQFFVKLNCCLAYSISVIINKIYKEDFGLKEGIHPEYMEATIICACGNKIETRSTKKEIHVEICSNCHPFYTGKQKIVDTEGRVERFKRKYGR